MVLPAPVVPLDETAVIDAAAAAMGVDIGELMERAGAALAEEAASMAGEGPILVVTGPGNNGGDGWVAARVLAAADREVQLWPVREPRSELCRQQAARLPAGVQVLDAPPTTVPALVIDAILGAGVSGGLRDWARAAVDAIRALGCPILAADAPTGIGGPDLLVPTRTLCFQVAKAELVDDQRCDEFKTVDVGIPAPAWEEVQPAAMVRFPRHHAGGHKGAHGELMVAGGGPFPGALHFGCRAGVIAGCDLVRAWTADGPPLPPGILVNRQPGRWLCPAMPEQLTPMLVRADALLIGPGLGREPGTPEAARQLFSLAMELDVPTVVDADGITHLAGELRELDGEHPPVVITPHRGEARTLLGKDVDDARIHAFARPDRVVLRKGRVDLITDGRRWQRNPRGNPRMAVGGTGDCLAGLTAGLLARGCGAFDAARLAALWLTTAGDARWQELGPCWDASDLLDSLPVILRGFLEPLGHWPPVDDDEPT